MSIYSSEKANQTSNKPGISEGGLTGTLSTSLLDLGWCYWSSIEMSWAELVPQATDWMTIFFTATELRSQSPSLCLESC